MATGPSVSRIVGLIDHRKTRRMLGLLDSQDGTVMLWSLHCSRGHTVAAARARRHLVARGFTVETFITDPKFTIGPYGRVHLTVSGNTTPLKKA